ncbi:flavin-containing monooxygenase 5-like [Hemitrygon akajei]|uniref:flavin-containing monooxygenase 5-like n=1 Tax=Hemitrygon akajei TaxID=2704970 RepID=UPI003BF9F734
MKSAKRVAIIGAGASGLTCIKSCLDEDLEPTCFEMSDDIDGIWNYQFSKDKGSIYKSLVTNTCKEMMCYSNFPMPGEYPNYMPHTKVLQYFRLYAENFDLMKYIRFKTNVCSVTKQQDFSSTGQWTVKTKDSKGNFASSVFDAVMICTGHHCDPHLPLELIPGKAVFKGEYMHSKEYKEPQPFEGKRVVIVGTGNSGGDLAVEISRFAKQVFLSTRRGAWIWNRIGYKGYPLDMMILTRFVCLLNNALSPFMNWYFQRSLNNKFDHENYGLQPTHSVSCQTPTVNDDLPHCIISGTVLVKSNVKRFTETAAIFEDGSVEEVDIVVFATGYTFPFPFLDESVVKVNENDVSLYKNVLPPQLEQPTLFVIGLIDPVGSIIPLSELQSRWAS